MGFPNAVYANANILISGILRERGLRKFSIHLAITDGYRLLCVRVVVCHVIGVWQVVAPQRRLCKRDGHFLAGEVFQAPCQF